MTPGAMEAATIDPEALVRDLERALGADALLPTAEWPRIRGEPVPTAAPVSLEALGECLRVTAPARVLPAGAGTWLQAGGWPRGGVDLVVSTRRLARVVSFEPDDLVATIEAGATLASLEPVLRGGGAWWPVDPFGGGVGTVGATIATASSGPLAAAYGYTRDNVLGLTVVLADGRVIRPGGRGGRVVKNVAGYDLTRLFAGSWGTLGVISEAHLRLAPLPAADSTAVILADAPEALWRLATTLDAAPLRPAATELLAPEAARALDGEAGAWQMWVRWVGAEAAVEGAAAFARRAADEAGLRVAPGETGGAPWSRLTEIEARVEAPATFRWQGLPTSLPDGLRLTRAFLGGGGGGGGAATIAAPALGRVWSLVPQAAWAAVPAQKWAGRIARLRAAAGRRGAWLLVERAPEVVLEAVDPWGDPGTAARVLRGVKEAFDPQGRLAPGRFRWSG